MKLNEVEITSASMSALPPLAGPALSSTSSFPFQSDYPPGHITDSLVILAELTENPDNFGARMHMVFWHRHEPAS
jgi:hypothetical protein